MRASPSVPIGEAAGVGVGCPRNWQLPFTLPPTLGTHMDSDRLEEKGGKPEREDGQMPACLPLGTQMILTACLLHTLCADLFKHYQLKTDPGLAQL